MKFFILFFCCFCLPYFSWANDSVFVFSKRTDDLYALEWNKKTYTLSLQSGLLNPHGANFPTFLLSELQLMMEAREHADKFNLRQALARALQLSSSRPIQELLFKLVHICFQQENRNCLQEIRSYPADRVTVAWALLYQGHLEDDSIMRLSYYRRAHVLAPEDQAIEYELQVAGLMVAESVLKHHEKLLNEHGIWKRMGTSAPANGSGAGLFWYSFKEALLNTTHAVEILLTDHEDDLLAAWKEQLEETVNLKLVVRALLKEMTENHTPLAAAFHATTSGQSLSRKLLLPATLSFQRSPYGQALLKGKILGDVAENSLLPSPANLGLHINLDFVNWDTGVFLVSQVNVLNVYMLFRGEAMFEYVAASRAAQWVAMTRIGIVVGNKLGLAAIKAKIANWPEWGRKAFIWFMTDQVLDGCLARYIYMGYSAIVQSGANGEVHLPRFRKK